MAAYLSHPRSGFYLRPRWHGLFRIPPGTVSNVGSPSNLPVRRRVLVHDQASATVVREGWSDAMTGQHGHFLEYLPAGTYYMISFDHTGVYGGVAETDIQSEPMP